MLVMSWWIWSRSIGVMNVLCSSVMVSCVILSALRSAVSMRSAWTAEVSKSAKSCTSARLPSTICAAWALNRSKNLPSRGISLLNMALFSLRRPPRAAAILPEAAPHARRCNKKARSNPARKNGGDEEDRTPDLRIANATLSQLSYVPTLVLRGRDSTTPRWKATISQRLRPSAVALGRERALSTSSRNLRAPPWRRPCYFSRALSRYAHMIIATPAMIIGTDSHCPIESPSESIPRKLSGSRVNSTTKRNSP